MKVENIFTKEEKAILNCTFDTSEVIDEKMCNGCMFENEEHCGVDNGDWDMSNWIAYKKSIRQKLVKLNLL